MSERRTVIPSARRLMTSLRGLPYDLPGAIADLVDNSLDADASQIGVTLDVNERGPFVRIFDDGVGMTERQIDEAMRYGSSRDYDLDDLGHYGLGLKTASLSQCRRLTVATRTSLKGQIRIRRWDLDRVSEQDAWVLEAPRARDCRPELTEPLRRCPGTVVLWEELDRILGTRRPDGEAAARRLQQTATEVGEELSMVFHRFLSGEAPGPSVEIRVNDEPLLPWDPFARAQPMTQALAVQKLPIEFEGRKHVVEVQPFILPNQHHFTSPDAHAGAAGPKKWNRQQGLYVYRRDRLIQSGGWNRLRTLDEHSKLARLALDIPATADGAFRTDVSKMHVGLPDDLRPQLRVLIAGVVTKAQDIYRQRVRIVPTPEGEPVGVRPMDDTGSLLSDQWPMITAVLERELADHPDLLDRVLVALVNAGPVASGPSPLPRSEAAQ